jgi:hypothetical protein
MYEEKFDKEYVSGVLKQFLNVSNLIAIVSASDFTVSEEELKLLDMNDLIGKMEVL